MSPSSMAEVEELEQRFSGAKPWQEELDPQDVKNQLVLGAYEVQLKVEEQFLKAAGQTPKMARNVIDRWRHSKANWLKRLLNDPTPLNIAWGTARDASVNKEEMAIARAICDEISKLMVGKKESIIHGSSSTGFMGYADRSFLAQARSILGSTWERAVRIFTIPLHWTVEKALQRELAAKNGHAKYRCPAHLKITDRTAEFFAKKPKRVICYPGGLGTLFEILLILVSMQLKGLLITVASGWKTNPPMYLIDFQDNEGNWFWNGLVELLRMMVKMGVIDQTNIDTLFVIRVGKGENKNSLNGSQIGVREMYFTSATEAAEFVMADR